MQITVQHQSVTQAAGDMLALGLFESVTSPGGALKAVDDALQGLASQMLAAGDFKGKLGETCVLYTANRLPTPRVLLVGLGKADHFTVAAARKAAAAAAKRARELGVAHLSTVVHGAGAGGLDPAQAAQAVVEGSLSGVYRFHSYKRDQGDKDKPEIAELTLLEADAAQLDALRAGARAGEIIGEAANWARDLVNEPANYLTPRELARRVSERAASTRLRVQVMGEAELAELGAGSFLGIARGSDEEAQFIVLEHQPEGMALDAVPTVALVGKAVTFDTGGISIKPAENMWRMKGDMSGGAATAAALLAASSLNLPVHAVGLIPATENMPGGDAIKPSDVVTAINGKTVEIISTDAEGRQIMADAMCYAMRYQPDVLIDIATLTGAIGLALGPDMAGLFCDDATLRERLLTAGEQSGENLWPLPIHKPYRRLIDSDVADMKNSGGRFGAAIIAAVFLREFAGDQPWAHLDIAATAWQEETSAFAARGASGFGARLLVELLRSYAGDWVTG